MNLALPAYADDQCMVSIILHTGMSYQEHVLNLIKLFTHEDNKINHPFIALKSKVSKYLEVHTSTVLMEKLSVKKKSRLFISESRKM